MQIGRKTVSLSGIVCAGMLLALAGCKQAPELPAVVSPYKIDVQQGNVITQDMIAKLKAAGVKEIPLTPDELVGRAVLTELVDAKKNRIADKNQRLTAEMLEKILESDAEEFKVIYFDTATATPVILDTLEMEKIETKEEAIAYATREGLAYRVEEPHQPLRRGISYSDNFKYNRTAPWTH